MKKIKILILICVILLIGILSFIIFNSKLKSYRQLDKILVSNQMDENLELPSGLYKLIAEYKGDLTTEIISKQYNHFATTLIPKYYKKCKDLSDDELTEFFNKNNDVIFIELGYENYSDFRDFINSIKVLNGDELIFESYSLLTDSLEKENFYCTIYLSIKYKNNNEIVFNSYVERKASKERTSIILKTDVDMVTLQEKIKERDEEEELQQERLTPNDVEQQELPKNGKVF